MKYLGVKIVDSEPMTAPEFNQQVRPLQYSGEDQRGYKVIYEDGYVSWSPKEVHEKAYRRIDNLTFGLAVEALKKGCKVARAGWNGKGMYIQLNPARDFEHSELLPFFTIKNVMNSFNTWVPSISDILAEDWMIVIVE
jgi:hypothetical protein